MSSPIDVFSPDHLDDPYPIYARVQRDFPVHRQRTTAGPEIHVLSRYADVERVLRDASFSVEEGEFGGDPPPGVPPELGAVFELIGAMMLRRDPPDHTRLRGIVNRAFTPSRVDKLRGRIQDIVGELLWETGSGRGMELVSGLAAPVPVLVIADLLGLPSEDRASIKTWSDELAPMIDGSLREKCLPGILHGMHALRAYLEEAVRRRREQPCDDLISALVTAQEADDRLTDLEVVATSLLLLVAGHETTTNLISNGMLALLSTPGQKEILLDAPERIPGAVEEMLRFDSPVQTTSRRPQQDVVFHGVKIPAHSEVDVLLGAANRDPEVFPDPHRFDVLREGARHLAFGRGLHFCLGAGLARLEAQVVVEALLAAQPDIALAEQRIVRKEGIVLRGLERLEVRF